MRFRRRVLDYTLAGVLLLVPLLILRSSLKEPEDLNRFDHAVLRVSSPLQAAVSWLVEGVGGAWGDYIWLVDVEDENEELRDEVDRLRLELADARRAATDTKILEELLALKQRTSADTVGARVVAASLAPYFRVVRIKVDRGKHEVQPSMPVINAEGLVGRIEHAYGEYSDVLLITDSRSDVSVRIRRTGATGSLKGLSTDSGYACEVLINEDEPVQEGDIVETRGLSAKFPQGLTVGTVTSVTPVPYKMVQKVTVRPAVDFATLDNVLVIVAGPPPTDPGGGKRRKSESAYGIEPF